jgi:hypothetical protein
LPLSVNRFEYKYIIFNPHTGNVQWEQGPNRVWSLEVVPLNDIWEEQTAALANLSKFELAQTISTLKKLHFKEIEEMKSEHKKQIDLREKAYSTLQNQYEVKVKELQNLKVECNNQIELLTKRHEERYQDLATNYAAAQKSNTLFVANTTDIFQTEIVKVLNEHICFNCHHRYCELENNETSCRYHVGVRLPNSQYFSCCEKNTESSEGCHRGKHVPRFPEEEAFVVTKFNKLMSFLTQSKHEINPTQSKDEKNARDITVLLSHLNVNCVSRSDTPQRNNATPFFKNSNLYQRDEDFQHHNHHHYPSNGSPNGYKLVENTNKD